MLECLMADLLLELARTVMREHAMIIGAVIALVATIRGAGIGAATTYWLAMRRERAAAGRETGPHSHDRGQAGSALTRPGTVVDADDSEPMDQGQEMGACISAPLLSTASRNATKVSRYHRAGRILCGLDVRSQTRFNHQIPSNLLSQCRGIKKSLLPTT